MGDVLKRLDKSTQDEARMAAAEALKLTHVVDNKVTSLINGTSGTSCPTMQTEWMTRSVCGHLGCLWPLVPLALPVFSVYNYIF